MGDEGGRKWAKFLFNLKKNKGIYNDIHSNNLKKILIGEEVKQKL